jgi:hypothetical protein
MVNDLPGEDARSGEGSAADSRRPTCPMCGNRTFRQEEGKLDSRWGLTAHRVLLLVCERCQFVLTFYEGNTIFDFD